MLDKTPKLGIRPAISADGGIVWPMEVRRRCSVLGVLSALATLFITSPAASQSPVNESPTIRSIMSNASVDEQSVNARLDALIESTKRAREERRAQVDFRPDRNSGISDPIGQRMPNPAGLNSDESGDASMHAENPTRSMSEIRERIRILQRLRRDRLTLEREALSDSIAGGVAPPVLTPPGGSVVRQNPTNISETASQESEKTLSPIDASLSPPSAAESTSNKAEEENSVLAAEQILPQPVNTLALGESLYRTGNFQSALKALQSVEKAGLSQSDRTWLDLLIALSQRRTGDFETAEGTLRDIANEESSDYPVKAARWWLKHAKSSNGTQKKLISLSAEFDSLMERSKSHVDP